MKYKNNPAAAGQSNFSVDEIIDLLENQFDNSYQCQLNRWGIQTFCSVCSAAE